MSTIMTRGGAETWQNRKLPPNVAYLTSDGCYGFGVKPKWKATTWKEIFAKRKTSQNSNLQFKRRSAIIKPCFIWVFYNSNFPYSGWWLYIKTLKKDYAVNFRNPLKTLQIKIMNLYPCGVIPIEDNFPQWAEEFAKTYHHAGFGRTLQGLKKCYCLIDKDGKIDVSNLSFLN